MTYALTLAGLRWLGLGKDPHAGTASVVIGNLIGFAAALPMALEANMVLLLEPALNPVWVWLLQEERPGA